MLASFRRSQRTWAPVHSAGGSSSGGARLIGNDPATELPIFVKPGPYGPYVQLGEDVPKASKASKARQASKASKTGKAGKAGKATPSKPAGTAAAQAEAGAPRRAALPAKVNAADVTMEQALALLSLPRDLGMHPEQQQQVLANVGRFGPYVKCGHVAAALPKDLAVSEVTLDTAVELLLKRRERLVARGIDPDAPLPKRGSNARAGAPSAGKKATAAGKAASKEVGSKSSTGRAAKASAKRKPAAGRAKDAAASSGPNSEAAAGSPAKLPSAYLLFCKQRREELKASGVQASPQQTMKLLAAEWRVLPEQQRQELRTSLSQPSASLAQPTA